MFIMVDAKVNTTAQVDVYVYPQVFIIVNNIARVGVYVLLA